MRPPEIANAAQARGGAAVATEIECTAYTVPNPDLQDFSCGTPNGKELLWLHKQRVSMAAITRPWIIGAEGVRFDGKAGFDFDKAGNRALIFRAEASGITTDLVAWSTHENRLASWHGSAFCIGDVEQCFSTASWFAGGGLRIHASPLDWLRARGAGIVILKPQLCWAYLRQVPRIICADIAHAETVRAWMKPPRMLTEFFVDTEEIAA
jgi:hypothetical protein